MEKQSKLDLWFLVPMLGIIVIGLMAVYSATHGTGDATLFYRQFSWGVIGLVVMSFVYSHDVRVIRDNAYIFYAIGILLLVAVLLFGKKVGGHSSWIKIGFFSFQPSEIAKMSTILALARFLSDDETDIRSLPHFFIALGIAFFPALLIILQLDMGTTITCMSFIAPMLIVSGFDIYILMLVAFPPDSYDQRVFQYLFYYRVCPVAVYHIDSASQEISASSVTCHLHRSCDQPCYSQVCQQHTQAASNR